METRYLTSMRNLYADMLLRNGESDRATEVATSDPYTPILKKRLAHPDEEPDPQAFNEMMSEMVYDLSILRVEFATMGYSLKELMVDANTRLKAIKRTLLQEKERQQDINILCNRYTDFGEVVMLSAADFTGDFSEDDGVFSALVRGQNNVSLSVAGVDGNGYEGNEYVYKNNAFLNNTIDTSNRALIVDRNDIPLYEYSRITASHNEKEVFPMVNFDTVEAKCVITLQGTAKFNALKIVSPDKDMVLSDVQVSNDGVTFTPALKSSIAINDADKKYEMKNYVPGSGVVAFPPSMYARITLESRGTTEDEIAFNKTEIK